MSHDFAGEANVAHEQAVNGRREVAVAALRDGEGQVLMVRAARLPSRWQPVGGGIEEEDADPVSTVVRELEEEAGVELPRESFRLVLSAPYDFGEGTVYCYEAFVGEQDVRAMSFNPREILEHRWVSLTGARKLPVFPATRRLLEALE